jgi:hypothetical protein
VAEAVIVAVPLFERVEGCVNGVARAAVVIVPVAQETGLLLRVDTQELQAQAEVPILPFVRIVDLRDASTDAVRVLVHSAAGDHLHRSVQVFAEVREILRLASVIPGTMAMQKLPDLPRHQYGISIHLQSPRIPVEAPVAEYPIPGLYEHATV